VLEFKVVGLPLDFLTEACESLLGYGVSLIDAAAVVPMVRMRLRDVEEILKNRQLPPRQFLERLNAVGVAAFPAIARRGSDEKEKENEERSSSRPNWERWEI
jgi:hypothetical protein